MAQTLHPFLSPLSLLSSNFQYHPLPPPPTVILTSPSKGKWPGGGSRAPTAGPAVLPLLLRPCPTHQQHCSNQWTTRLSKHWLPKASGTTSLSPGASLSSPAAPSLLSLLTYPHSLSDCSAPEINPSPSCLLSFFINTHILSDLVVSWL